MRSLLLFFNNGMRSLLLVILLNPGMRSLLLVMHPGYNSGRDQRRDTLHIQQEQEERPWA